MTLQQAEKNMMAAREEADQAFAAMMAVLPYSRRRRAAERKFWAATRKFDAAFAELDKIAAQQYS